MLGTILGWVVKAIAVLPSLIINVENLWAPTKQAGTQKSEAIDAALAGSIQDVASAVVKLAPAGSKESDIAGAIATFTASVNNAFVALMNDLGIFKHDYTATTPPPSA